MERDSFIFYKNWVESIRILPKSMQMDAFYALADYALYGKKSSNKNSAIKVLLSMAKMRIDDDCKKYSDISQTRRDAVNKRWDKYRAEKNVDTNSDTNSIQNDTKIQMYNLKYYNDNDNDNDNYIINNNYFKEKPTKESDECNLRFIPPTIGEVNDYILSKHYHFNAEEFCAFYESKGWMVGKNKMKDWRAACRTWEAGYKKRNTDTTVHFAGEDDLSVYDTDKEKAYWGQG